MAEPAASEVRPRGHRVGTLSALSLFASGLERVFSIILIAVVAALYGVSADTDTYYLALIVPAALGLGVADALYTVFLRAFTQEPAPSRTRLRWAVRRSLLTAATVTAVYIAVVAAVRPAGTGVWLAFALGLFAGTAQAPYVAFLTACQRYAVATLRVPFTTAVALVTAVILLSTWRSITGLAIAISVGQLASLVVLAVYDRRHAVADPARGRAWTGAELLGPAASVFAATLVGTQAVIVLERFLATTLDTGAVTLLVNARGFVVFPVMVSSALASGVFPAIAERQRLLDDDSLRRLALFAGRLGIVTALVSVAYVAICRRELVRLVLERGEFNASDAGETARLIAIMAPALLGLSVAAIAGRALFGLGRQRVVALVSVAGVALYVVLALALRDAWGIEGLAAAYTASSIATGALLAGVEARIVRLEAVTALREWLVAPLALACVFALAAWSTRELASGAEPSSLGALAGLAAAGAAGAAALGVVVVAAGTREYQLALERLRPARLRARITAETS